MDKLPLISACFICVGVILQGAMLFFVEMRVHALERRLNDIAKDVNLDRLALKNMADLINRIF